MKTATWEDVDYICDLMQSVKFCLHGGFAMELWGGVAGSPDVDLCLPKDLGEFTKMQAALGVLPKKKTLVHPAAVMMRHNVIRLLEEPSIDIMIMVGGSFFEDLEIFRVTRPSGLVIPVVSGDSLVRIKQFSMRNNPKHKEKNEADLKILTDQGYNGNFTKQVIPHPNQEQLLTNIDTGAE